MQIVERILKTLETKGAAQYGREPVSQLEHALQSAALAEAERASPGLVAAALLHDLGHLLYTHDRTGSGQDRDDRHEQVASGHLSRVFGAEVVQPIRLHVDAKRWLCANEAGYFEALSSASVRSLELQGGPFTPAQSTAFLERPFAADAIRLRRWDDLAKVPGAATRALADYRGMLQALARVAAEG
jgi:phosphonate degradation associated HDIG domain protein